VTIYLVNGFQLRGVVKGFDPFTIVLEYEKRAHLIYKHAVSTISRWAGFGSAGARRGRSRRHVTDGIRWSR